MPLSDPINPAEQVEKIREILIGRDLERFNDRVRQLETRVDTQSSLVSTEVSQQMEKVEAEFASSQQNLQSMTSHIRQQLQQESVTRSKQVNELAGKIDAAAEHMVEASQKLMAVESDRGSGLEKQLENLSSEMAARIDAHSRQIMEHLHREIQQWKGRMDGQLTSLNEGKVDKQELTTRLARIASAAMGDAVPPTMPEPQMAPPSLSKLDVFAMPTDDFTTED